MTQSHLETRVHHGEFQLLGGGGGGVLLWESPTAVCHSLAQCHVNDPLKQTGSPDPARERIYAMQGFPRAFRLRFI